MDPGAPETNPDPEVLLDLQDKIRGLQWELEVAKWTELMVVEDSPLGKLYGEMAEIDRGTEAEVLGLSAVKRVIRYYLSNRDNPLRLMPSFIEGEVQMEFNELERGRPYLDCVKRGFSGESIDEFASRVSEAVQEQLVWEQERSGSQ